MFLLDLLLLDDFNLILEVFFLFVCSVVFFLRQDGATVGECFVRVW